MTSTSFPHWIYVVLILAQFYYTLSFPYKTEWDYGERGSSLPLSLKI